MLESMQKQIAEAHVSAARLTGLLCAHEQFLGKLVQDLSAQPPEIVKRSSSFQQACPCYEELLNDLQRSMNDSTAAPTIPSVRVSVISSPSIAPIEGGESQSVASASLNGGLRADQEDEKEVEEEEEDKAAAAAAATTERKHQDQADGTSDDQHQQHALQPPQRIPKHKMVQQQLMPLLRRCMSPPLAQPHQDLNNSTSNNNEDSEGTSQTKLPGRPPSRSPSLGVFGSEAQSLENTARSQSERQVWASESDQLRQSKSERQIRDNSSRRASSKMQTSHTAPMERQVSRTDFASRAPPELHPVWQGSTGHEIQTKTLIESHFSSVYSESPNLALRVGDSLADRCICLVQRPASPKRIFWDMLSTIVIMYDMLTLPLQVFHFEDQLWAKWLSISTTAFWTADMFMSLITGYHKTDGVIELRFSRIVNRYMRTWFFLDFLVVATDWTMLILDSDSANTVNAVRLGKVLRTVRLGRLFRLFRFVRIVKMVYILEHIVDDNILAAPLVTFWKITRLLIGLAIVVHFIACGWYAIGSMDLATTWASGLMHEGASKPYMYLVAYHWSIAQFTPAPNNFHPTNWQERLYAVVVLFLGLVLFSSLLGSTTALINQSRSEAASKMRDAEILRRFLTDHKVSLSLGNRIIHFLKEVRVRSREVIYNDVPALQLLPPSLSVELHYEAYCEFLKEHTLFHHFDSVHRATMEEICHSAICEKIHSKGEEPFRSRTVAKSMLWLRSGKFTYKTFTPVVGKQVRTLFEDEGIFSEGALWCFWEHRGNLIANSQSSLMHLMVQGFHSVVERDHEVTSFFTQYAVLFLNKLLSLYEENVIPDDTFSPCNEILNELCPISPTPSKEEPPTPGRIFGSFAAMQAARQAWG